MPRNAAMFLFFYYTKHVMQSQICLTLHNIYLKFRIKLERAEGPMNFIAQGSTLGYQQEEK